MLYTLFILLLPFLSFLLIGLINSKLSHKAAGAIGVFSIALVALLSYFTAWQYFTAETASDVRQAVEPFVFEWLKFSDQLQMNFGILLDPISVMMLVVISTVSLMVHIYSISYMHGEDGFQRYYAYLSLFTFSMLGLVVSTNIFQMYIFWELVGVSSFLLIGFYFHKPEALAAAKKAFIVTRFADLGFLLGILVLSYYTKTFDFNLLNSCDSNVFASATGASFMGISAVSWAMALIFIGGAGKSAMFPLHIWLPDAMEGPTPVSALIHAATMVVAGVYLVARLFPVYYFYSPEVLHWIAYVGAFTSLFAATIACTQTDIKRVLAYSTISQIGFMMVGLGVSGMGGHHGLGYMASMFHLFTHAMFKALLFLGAGSVIHAVHSNEMSKMGGLRKYMKVTHVTFLIACLAIAGIWPLSGFFSKDEILSATYSFSPVLGVVMTLIAALTSFYMFRLYFGIFWGQDKTHKHVPHESPFAMRSVLIVLAVITLVAGFIPFGHFVTNDGRSYDIHINYMVAGVSIFVAICSIAIAFFMYRKESPYPALMVEKFKALYTAAYHRFYIDEVYLFITKKIIFRLIAQPTARVDKQIVGGTMDGFSSVTQWISYRIKGLQNGDIQYYTYVILIGSLFIAAIVMFI